MLLRILLDVHEMNLSLAITCNLLTDTNQITTVERNDVQNLQLNLPK